MTIAKKPRATGNTVPKQELTETDIQALIEKGGSVASKAHKEEAAKEKPKLVQLRLEKEVLDRIDTVRESRLVKMPRHSWLLEAILEKLSREEENVERMS